MQTLQTVLFVVQVLVSAGLIGFILLQQGKGADAGAAFGSGASSTVFGARGSGNFLTRTTSVLALIFLINSLVLSYMASQQIKTQGSLMEHATPAPLVGTQQQSIPAQQPTPAPTPAVPVDKPSTPASTGSEVPEVPTN
jgi:preprotein translocase subunit SecG